MSFKRRTNWQNNTPVLTRGPSNGNNLAHKQELNFISYRFRFSTGESLDTVNNRLNLASCLSSGPAGQYMSAWINVSALRSQLEMKRVNHAVHVPPQEDKVLIHILYCCVPDEHFSAQRFSFITFIDLIGFFVVSHKSINCVSDVSPKNAHEKQMRL